MSLVNSKATALYLKQQQALPVPPNNFIETTEPLIVVPQFSTVDTNRLSGAMNSKDSVIDTCRARSSFFAKVAMRETGTTNLQAPPEWAELAKISGFIENTSISDVYELKNGTTSPAKGSAVVTVDSGKHAFNFTNTLVGDIAFTLPIGQIATVDCTLSGYMDSPVPTDITTPATNTLNTEAALVVSCADIITSHGTSIPAEQIVFKMNPDISNTYTMGGAQGIKQDTITDYGITCEITFPVESASFGREASMIDAGTIDSIRVVLGADANGKPVDGKSFVFMADASKATTYADTVNNNLLQRTLTLRLYDSAATPALRILSGKVSTI